jgi:hypothetical protein
MVVGYLQIVQPALMASAGRPAYVTLRQTSLPALGLSYLHNAVAGKPNWAVATVANKKHFKEHHTKLQVKNTCNGLRVLCE